MWNPTITLWGKSESVDPTIFKRLVGSLWYLTCIRPDIHYSVGIISRLIEKASTTNLKVAKRILRYIKSMINYGMHYSIFDNYELLGYNHDSNWEENVDEHKSTTGFVLYMGNTAFTWMLKKQQIFALYICELDHVAAISCVCYVIWLRNLLKELRLS